MNSQFLAFVYRWSYAIIVAFALLSIAGLGIAPKLSVKYAPGYQLGSFNVLVTWPGAPASEIERTVVAPLEAGFALLQGIGKISSTTRRGSAVIRLTLTTNDQLDYQRFLIAAQIRHLYTSFPQGVMYPRIVTRDPEDVMQDRPILVYTVTADMPGGTIYRYAKDHMATQFAGLQGVERVQVHGAKDDEWLISYNDERLSNLGLTIADLKNAIKLNFARSDLGFANVHGHTLAVRIKSATEEKDTWSDIVIDRRGDYLLKLGDVANVQLQPQPDFEHYRINGRTGIRLLVYPTSRANHVDLANRMHEQVQAIEADLPGGYKMYLDEDATEYLRAELFKILQRTLWSLAILVFFLILIFRNFRWSLVIILSLLANICIASILYYFLDIELHLYALAAITVSFGLIMDNAIVFSHHTLRHGNTLVVPALLAGTFTTLSALVVIFFLPYKWQVDLSAFAKVLVINLSLSLIVAFVLVPALMHRLNVSLRRVDRSLVTARRLVRWQIRYALLLGHLIRRRALVIVCVVLLFGTPVFMLPNSVENWDHYNKVMDNAWYKENIRPWVNRSLGGMLRLFVWHVYDGAVFRAPAETMLNVRATMPPGTTLRQMDVLCTQVENYLETYPRQISRFVTNINSGENARIRIHFAEGIDKAFPRSLRDKLIGYTMNLGGVKWSIFGVGTGYSSFGHSTLFKYWVNMAGNNSEELRSQAMTFKKLLEENPRVKNASIEGSAFSSIVKEYVFRLEVDRQRLMESGMNPSVLLEEVQKYDKSTGPDMVLNGYHNVRFQPKDWLHWNRWSLENIPLHSANKQLVLGDIVSLEKVQIGGFIEKEDQQFIRIIEFEYAGMVRFGSQYLTGCISQMRKQLPFGYTINRNERSNLFFEEQKKQYELLLLVIGLIFFICAIMFESLKQSLATILLIPTSYIGIILTFYCFDITFDQGGYTAFILLSGLVVNSIILLINDYNYYRKKYPRRTSLSQYTKAVQSKIIPIFLTIISTAFGLTPFMMHGKGEVFWFALAAGTIGGLIFSIVVVLLFIPVFFVRLEEKQL